MLKKRRKERMRDAIVKLAIRAIEIPSMYLKNASCFKIVNSDFLVLILLLELRRVTKYKTHNRLGNE